MNDITNKDRLIKLIEIFERETDHENQYSIKDLVEKLKIAFGEDFKVDDRAIKRDIEAINNSKHMYIIDNVIENNKKIYSYQNRLFELYELRMLIDAVSSARFITEEETKKIVEKIKKLTSNDLAKKLQNQIHLDNRVKVENTKIRYYIDQIHTAISEQNKIRFQYGKYNVNKEFVLNRVGQFYPVEPIALIWLNDYYYLIGKYNSTEEIRHYRIDRMRNLSITDNRFKIDFQFNINEYINKTFNMYSGEKEELIEIQFDNHLINVIIDKFTKDVMIRKVDDNHFSIKTKAVISEGLIRWILTWGSDAKVTSPKNLIEEVREETKKMYQVYNN